MIGKVGERLSWIPVLHARHDDDDIYIYYSIHYWQIITVGFKASYAFRQINRLGSDI